MAHAPTPQHRPASTPIARAARSDAATRPDDAARAWAFLARRTAWERQLDALRSDAGQAPLAPVVPPVRTTAPPTPMRRTEAA